ncbi:RYamide receptor-like [Lytechinus pictus]|uniref:RYamide receptor-like n=1 Tax=Lytechinus pictus TaxID=7653 RepID=UPI0030B9ADDF
MESFIVIMNSSVPPDNYSIISGQNYSEIRDLYKEPPWIQAIYGLLFTLVTVFGVGGNSIVCYIVLGHARMRTVTNYSIVNLAVSDILMAVMCVNFSFYAAMYMTWPFGEFMCKAVSYIQSVSVSVSIFTLVSISVDRYIAICHPLVLRMGSSQALAVIAVIWVVACVVALPSLIFSTVGVEGDSTFCSESNWEQSKIYTYVLMGIQYFVPLCVLAVAYGRIGYVIWSRRTPGETQASRDKRINESKTKLVKMFAMVVLLFALCYLPIHSFNILQEVYENVLYYRYIKLVYLTVLLAAMSNCVYNPFIYCWMNAKFRNGFRHVFRFLPCVHYDTQWKVIAHLERGNTAMTQLTTSPSRRLRSGPSDAKQCWPEHCYESLSNGDGSPLRNKVVAV